MERDSGGKYWRGGRAIRGIRTTAIITKHRRGRRSETSFKRGTGQKRDVEGCAQMCIRAVGVLETELVFVLATKLMVHWSLWSATIHLLHHSLEFPTVLIASTKPSPPCARPRTREESSSPQSSSRLGSCYRDISPP